VVATVRSDAPGACIPRTRLPDGVYDISVIRCGGAAAVCRPFKTSAEGSIWDDAWLVVGPFLNANDGCDGTGDTFSNHIAPSRIECFYPAAGEELPYDPAAPGQRSLGYRGTTGLGGMPLIVPFDDGFDDGFLNLDGHYGDRFNVMAFLVTYVEYTGEPAQVGVCVGSDDGAQVWFNDIMVLNDPSCRFLGACEAQVTVDVEPGVYRIAFGVWENIGRWRGLLALTDPETGEPIIDDGSSPWRFLGTERPPADRFPGGAYPCVGTPGPRFHRGDADGNGDLEITDALRILSVLFLGGGRIRCDDAADADDSGELDLTDAVTILNVLFLGTGMIPPPGPTLSPCGPDLGPDRLGCLEYDGCR